VTEDIFFSRFDFISKISFIHLYNFFFIKLVDLLHNMRKIKFV
jgi:hypothetical protein